MIEIKERDSCCKIISTYLSLKQYAMSYKKEPPIVRGLNRSAAFDLITIRLIRIFDALFIQVQCRILGKTLEPHNFAYIVAYLRLRLSLFSKSESKR